MNSVKRLFLEEDLIVHGSDHRRLRTAPRRCCPNLIWREKVAQWCYDVVDHLGESRGTVYIAMNILDRYSGLNFSARTAEREYEAAALTALFMAIRIAGKVSLAASDLLRMSRQGVKVQEIVNVGKAMTEQLSWNHRVVTPIEFVQAVVGGIMDGAPESLNEARRRHIITTATFLCEVAVCDCFFVNVAASRIAVSAISASISCLTPLPHDQRHHLMLSVSHLTGLQLHSQAMTSLDNRLHRLLNQSNQRQPESPCSPHIIPISEEDELTHDDIPIAPHRVVSSECLVPNMASDFQPPTSNERQRAVSPTTIV